MSSPLIASYGLLITAGAAVAIGIRDSSVRPRTGARRFHSRSHASTFIVLTVGIIQPLENRACCFSDWGEGNGRGRERWESVSELRGVSHCRPQLFENCAWGTISTATAFADDKRISPVNAADYWLYVRETCVTRSLPTACSRNRFARNMQWAYITFWFLNNSMSHPPTHTLTFDRVELRGSLIAQNFAKIETQQGKSSEIRIRFYAASSGLWGKCVHFKHTLILSV